MPDIQQMLAVTLISEVYTWFAFKKLNEQGLTLIDPLLKCISEWQRKAGGVVRLWEIVHHLRNTK